MHIFSNETPLDEAQAEALNHLLSTLTPTQTDWLAGFIAGWQASHRDSASLDPGKTDHDSGPSLSLTVLYGSQTGNAEGLAETLGQQARARGLSARVIDMADYKPRQLKNEAYVAVITSTHGEGDPPDNALDLHEFLHGRKAPSLKHLKFAVLGLGDTSYEHYCQTGKEFGTALAKLGATPLCERVDCDVDYDDAAEAWFATLLETLQGEAGASGLVTSSSSTSYSATTASSHGRRTPFPAELLENQVLNGRGSSKETLHIELSLEGSGLSYQPGDALGVYPQNDPHLVATIIERLGLDPDTGVKVGDVDTPLANALQHHREITLLTRPVIERWAEFSGNQTLKALLEDHAQLSA